MEKFSYRKYIYGNYRSNLENNMIFRGGAKKEYKTLLKYINRNYKKHLPEDKESRILDLGCGLGYYIQGFKELGYANVDGVDLSEDNVKYCRDNGLNCIQADALSYLKSHHNVYDVIVFNDVIEHFTKDEMYEILIEMQKTLKKGGILIIKTYNMANPFTGLSGRYMDLTHEIGFTENTFRQIFASLDFKEAKVVGADIYVIGGIFGHLCRLISKIFYFLWYVCCCFVGRNSVRIFEKNMICIARK